MAQAERELRRRFTGNVVLYMFLDRYREKRFLKRNLEKALKYHVLQEKIPIAKPIGNGALDRDVIMQDIGQEASDQGLEISRERTMLTPASSISPNAENILAKQRPLDKFMETVKPSRLDEILPAHILKIEVTSLKRRGQELEEHLQIMPQPPLKRLKSKLTVCRCELKIYGQGPCDKALRLMVQDTQICSFSRALGGPEDTIVEIDLVEGAFYVKADRLLGESQKGTRRIQSLLDSYRIVISFTPIGSAGWPLLEDEYTSRHLVSVYDGLPGSSPDGSLLDVEVASAVGGTNVPCTHFALEVKTLWSTPPPRPQEALRPKPSSHVRQIPPSVPQIKYIIGPSNSPYENGATKRQKLRGYFCLLCHGREFSSLEFLHFHLLTSHDNFKYKLVRKDTLQPGARWNIYVDIAEYRGHNDEDEDDKTVKWVRPCRPFILSKYLGGDESWITGKAPLPTPPPAPVQPSGSSLSATNPHARKTPGGPTVIDPDAIPDLPPRNPKKVPVPPGGRYFRTLSKRRLKAGEMLTDSDDEVDESWLVQKHNETLDDFADVFAAEKVFMKRFDEHMLRENLSGHRYVPNSLVRFCRANRAFLNTPDMIVEFWKQTLYLVQHGVINAAHVKVCMDIIGGTGEGQRSRVKLGSSIPHIAEESHDDSPLARLLPKSPTIWRRHARGSLGSEMDVGGMNTNDISGISTGDDEQLEKDVRKIIRGESESREDDEQSSIHGDARSSNSGAPPQQLSIRTMQVPRPPPPPAQTPRPPDANGTIVAPSTVTTFASGDYINTELCFGGCGPWTRSNIIVCLDPMCDKPLWHLSCLGLKKRTENWRCQACSAKAITPLAPPASSFTPAASTSEAF